MALVLANRVKETSTTTGTGTLSLAGAVTGFQTFVDGIGTTNTTYYSITDESGNFEVGLGTVTDGTPDTLSRDTVLESSNSNALVNFGSGTKTIFVTQPAERAVYQDSSCNVSLPNCLNVTNKIKGGCVETSKICYGGAIEITGTNDICLTPLGDVELVSSVGCVAVSCSANASAVNTFSLASGVDFELNCGSLKLNANSSLGGGNNFLAGDCAGISITGQGACGNTYLGACVGRSTTSGFNNTAMGVNALGTATGSSNGNTAIGARALELCCLLVNNTAVGQFSQTFAGGIGNTSVGESSLYVATGSYNTGVGTSTMRGGTLSGHCNTSLGYTAGYCTTTGCSNVYIGAPHAGYYNCTGKCNVAIGAYAMRYNRTRCSSTVVGVCAAERMCCGGNTTHFGWEAGRYLRCSYENTIAGYRAVRGSNTIGYMVYSTMLGAYAGYCSCNTQRSTAVGYSALNRVCRDQGGVYLGACAGYGDTTSNTIASTNRYYNTYVGYAAGYRTGAGNCNTAIGTYAGFFISCGVSTGNNNTLIGAYAGSCGCGPGLLGMTNVIGNCSNMIVMGNCNNTCALIKVAWTTVSDCRDKSCICCVPHGLDFVRALNPISYKFRCNGRENPEVEDKERYGFLAQEIQPLEGNKPVVVTENDPELLGMSDQYLIPILVKAVKELSDRVDELET